MYFWYREVSYDEDFVQEVRHSLRYATAILLKRIHNVNVTHLIIKKAIPLGVNHLDALIHADEFKRHVNQTLNRNMSFREAFLDYMGPNIHPAACNRAREVEYVRNAASKLLPLLIPVRFQSSRLVCTLPEKNPSFK